MRLIKTLRKLWAKGPKEIIKRGIKKILLGRGITFFERFGLHVLPVHYYSPVPCMRDLRKNVEYWYKEGSFTGVNFNIKEQLDFLDKLKKYKNEYDALTPYDEVVKQRLGEGYGEVEAHILYAMIRYFKPHTIIEVGSGISTFFSANALSFNKSRDLIDSKIICIEPYPWQKLKDMSGNGILEIIAKPVQEVDIEFFKTLKEGDILFIDSSHVVKAGSDVNYLYLEVLPNLNKGIIIHIHDIFFPYPSFNSELWMFGEHRFWTESDLVQAFLIYNAVFKMLLCSSYLHYKRPKSLQSAFNIYNPKKHFPSSLWLQKVS